MIDARRLPAFLLAFLTLLSFALPLAAQAREMVSAVRDEVNLRSGPGSRYDTAWIVSRGYPLEIVGRRGAWLRVRDFENDRAWVLSSRTKRTPHHIVTASAANLRSTPSTRGRIVGKARYGDVLRTLQRRGEWVKVRLARGTTGWVARRLLWGW
ncbi:SH3 domain-containing protein [Variovorax sp. RA8]|uniref:SH3 domain-containing protein n=1 Tax=Variovorax sp. (strain JCM 16519 / RA8) TaxID=662548 RepID=UPI0013174EA1|nr:SH3 domain-containing protein [Variovorax sp. RA8]VTU26218.1 SH3 domain-containing protein [Variovorax sp. RA8]